MVTDQISDLLTRIRNGQMVGHPSVQVPASRKKLAVVKVLIDEGFLHSYEESTDEKGKPSIKVHLRYDDRGGAVIKELNRLSRPGRRQYVGKDEIPKFRSGLGVVVVSTPKGVITDREARKLGVGGELVCEIF